MSGRTDKRKRAINKVIMKFLKNPLNDSLKNGCFPRWKRVEMKSKTSMKVYDLFENEFDKHLKGNIQVFFF